jgi:DNA polymerase elongation subunit (family B)
MDQIATIERVLVMAATFGLEHKLDPSRHGDVVYLTKWMHTFERLQQFKNSCSFADDGRTLHEIEDPRTFSCVRPKYQLLLERLHEDFDDFPDIIHAPQSLTVPLSRDTNDQYGQGELTIDTHVVDVDYEYEYTSGLQIILYTRVIGSDDTVFVRYPYNDYFYIQVTPEVTPEVIVSSISSYCWFLSKIKYKEQSERCDYSADNRRNSINMDLSKPLVISTEVVHGLKSMYGYQPNDQTFIKVVTVNPTVTRDLFTGLSKKYNGETREEFATDRGTGIKTSKGMTSFPEMMFFEVTTDVTNKFLTEHSLSGCSAVRVVGNRVGQGRSPYSTCTVAIDCTSLTPLPNAPFYEPRTLFYDMECLSLDVNEFPTSNRCPVIQISFLLAKGMTTIDQGVLCVHETPGYDWYDTEEQVLIAFAKKIIDFNPDNVTGFNSNSFDMPYIIDRMKVLGIYDVASCWSRRLGFKVDYKRDFKESKQFGTKEIVKYTTPGRVMFDQMEIIKGNPMIRLRSYALKSICAEFLGDENKEDIRYKDIPDLYKSVEGRQKIASYCLQDTVLLKKLDDKLLLGIDVAAQAKVQGITPNVVLNRGLVFRIMCKIKSYTEKYNFLIPTFTKKQFPNSPTYIGATVLNCDAGYYTDCVTVLDFASLYPSLMIAHNLDYTTIAMDDEVVKKYPERFNKFDNGYAFVKSEFLRGLLPRVELELGRERHMAKNKMKDAKDGVEKAVWNAIQGGVKIVMNSIYGLVGSPTATVPCVPIAATITFMGRTHLQQSKDYVEANYCRITGEPPNNQCKVIYGDTVRWGGVGWGWGGLLTVAVGFYFYSNARYWCG